MVKHGLIQMGDSLNEKVIYLLDNLGVDVNNIRFTNDNIMIGCPFAAIGGHTNSIDRKPSFGLKVTDSGFYYNCFTCGVRGRGLVHLVEELNSYGLINGGIDEAYKLQSSLRLNFPEYEFDFNNSDDSGYDLYEGDDGFSDYFWEYNKKRGLNTTSISQLELKWDSKKESIIFPVFNFAKEEVGYVQHIPGKGYYNSKFDRDRTVYLEWLIKGKTGILVEGMYDAAITYQHLRLNNLLDKYSVVAMFGSKVTLKQCALVEKHFDRVIIYSDNDLAGIKMDNDVYRILSKRMPLIFKLHYEGSDPGIIKNSKMFKKLLSNNLSLFKQKN